MMIRYYLKTSIRRLKANKMMNFIIIFGVSVSIASILVISKYVKDEYDIDKFNENYHAIVRVFNVTPEGEITFVKADATKAFFESSTAVEGSCAIDKIELNALTSKGTLKLKNVLSTESSFLDLFSYELLFGDSSCLSDEQSIVLTESTAKNIFGTNNPIGKNLTVSIGETTMDLVVAAIMNDPKKDSRFQFEALVPFSNESFHFNIVSYSDWDSEKMQMVYLGNLYLLLHSNTQIELLNQKLKQNIYRDSKNKFYSYLQLQPLSEVYFDNSKIDQFRHGNKSLLYIFLALAFALLVMAFLNYINLSAIKNIHKTIEIGYKKVIGASWSAINSEFLVNAILIGLISTLCTLLFIMSLSKLFGFIIEKTIDISVYYHPISLLGLFVLMITISAIAELISVKYFRSTDTIALLKGASLVRQFKVLKFGNQVTLQFIISILLIVSVFVIQNQLGYISNKNLGFDKENLIHISVDKNVKFTKLKSVILENANIEKVSFSNGVPGKLTGTDGKNWFISADENFISTFKIKLIKGRNFKDSDKDNVCLVNEEYIRKNKLNNCVGSEYHGMKIIGVVEDFQTTSQFEKIVPLQISFSKTGFSDVSIRYNKHAETRAIISFINRKWDKITPQTPLEYYIYKDWLTNKYTNERLLGKLLLVFSVIAIIISCLGLIVLSAFLIKKRVKEIGIRKINGATTISIIKILNINIIKWVAIAFIIATPIAYYAMNKWLENFAYKTSLSWWIFALAGLSALVIALLTVSWQSYRAASRNPVEALRYE